MPPTRHLRPISSTRRRGWAVLVFATTLLVCLGLGETALRVFWTNPYATESSDLLLKLRVHHPNRRMRIDRSSVYPNAPYSTLRTNALGYILPANQYPDPDFTVAFLGGSTTECDVVSEGLRFPALISTRLSEAGLRVNTINAGNSGNSAHDSLNIFVNRLVEDPPDVAVLMHATNDIGLLTEGHGHYREHDARELEAGDVEKWLLLEASSRFSLGGLLRSVYDRYGHRIAGLAYQGVQEERPLVSEVPFTHQLQAFIGMCRGLDVVPVLMTQPMSGVVSTYTPYWVDERNQLRFNDVIRRVAAAEGVVVIDLVKYLKDEVPSWDAPMNVFYDGIHLTEKGSELYAAHIAQVLRTQVLPNLGSQSLWDPGRSALAISPDLLRADLPQHVVAPRNQ